MAALHEKKCEPCAKGTPPLPDERVRVLAGEVPLWQVADRAVAREFKFKNFREALAFVNRVGVLAEAEGHHPDLLLHRWNRVRVTLSTHAISGLSENDFVLAAKIDRLPER